jgi:predicted Zn-dependent peptidase
VLLAGCDKKTEDADRAPGGTQQAETGPGEITSFRLDNGITVYLREDRSRPQTAVEVLYRGGVFHEEKGHVHASRLLPHLMIFAPTASFAQDEAVGELSIIGRINGEVVGEFTRFDYMAPSDQFELILKIESERITSAKFTDDLLEIYAKKCTDDIDKTLERPNASLSKYGLMALNQAYNHGLVDVPVYNGVHDLTIDDVQRFRQTNYRLSDMLIVVVGDFDTGQATKLIKNYFGNIVVEPLERTVPRPTSGDITAYWDLPSTVMFLVYPGPYQDDTERIVLTMFGNFLNRQLKATTELLGVAKATFCSNTTYPVGDIPFFIFVQNQAGWSTDDVRTRVLPAIEESLALVDEKMFDTMKINLVDYFESSVLASQRNLSVVRHTEAITQEALNIGMKHYLGNGATTEEFIEKVRSIKYEDARRYLDARLTPDHQTLIIIKEK